MPNYPAYGRATRVTASGYSNICAVDAQIVGVMFNGSGTGICTLYHGVTASGQIAGVLRAYTTVTGATVNAALYLPCPAYASGGITINVGSTGDPDVTLFWNPA